MTLKLFVADDSETIHKVISLAFDGLDAVVEFATSGDAAMEGIRKFRPDIVLADVCLPGVNGYEICARVKNIPELAAIPVVLLVGTFEPFDEAEASRAGYAACLTKPFDTSELIDVVQRKVGRDTMSPEKESEASFNSAVPDASSAAVLNEKVLNSKIPVTRQAWDSFLGTGRVLDVFDAGAVKAAGNKLETKSVPFGGAATAVGSSSPPPPISADQLSDEVLDRIVEKVVKRMSADIVSEIAWEVVPELSEILIKRTIEENTKQR